MDTLSTTLARAGKALGEGRLAEAEDLCARVLAESPECIDALTIGCALAARCGDRPRALSMIRRAVALAPERADLHNTLGQALAATGDADRAMAAFEKALLLNPDFAEVHYNLGLALRARGRDRQAAERFEAAATLRPDWAEAHFRLAAVLSSLGDWAAAEERYRCALQRRPDDVEIRYNLGGALKALGRLSEAEAVYAEVVLRRPDFAMALNNLGVVRTALGDLDGAMDCYRRALVVEPDNAETHNNLGSLLERCDRMADAVDHCRRAVALKPSFAEAHNNLGVALSGAGRPAEGDAAFLRALSLRPDFTAARFNHAVTRLLLGDFEQGWAAYESRFERPEWTHIHPHRYDRPRWRGESFRGRRLYVHDEQGFGDTIQFIRYLPRVKALGGTVILETRAPLMPLLAGIDGVDELVARPTGPAPAVDCDLVVPLMSLAGIFGTDEKSIPAPIPYIAPDPQRVSRWRSVLGDAGLRVGLVWAGSANHEQDRRRSIPLAALAPLAGIGGVRLFGLQKGAGAEAATDSGILEANLGDTFADFADTAAAMAALDLVITVDTAAAHLGGALGVPVWVLLPRRPDWRWQLDREDSSWYPGLRLFRQGEDGDWEPVVAHVADALNRFAQQQPASSAQATSAGDAVQMAYRLFRDGNADQAREILTPHLQRHPQDARALNLMAAAHYQQGRIADALRHAEAAVASAPGDADIRVNRGRILAALGRSGPAVEDFEIALSNRPGHRAAALALADVLADSDHPEAGIAPLASLLALTPSDAAARLGLSRLFRTCGRTGDAVKTCREGTALAPEDASLQVALGVALAADGRAGEAEQVFEDALAKDGGNADALHNLGVLRMAGGRLADAAAAFEKTITLNPDHADARFNLAQLHLLEGRFAAGWAGYQWRMKKPAWRRRYPMGAHQELWVGRPFHGRRLCLRHEQGLGDTLQFVRYLPMVKALGGAVVLEAAPVLHGVLRDAAGIDRLEAPAGDRLPPADCDLVAPLMSLPLIFDTRETTIPAEVPYLWAPEPLQKSWHGRIPARGRLRAGLVWAGNAAHANDANRSLPLEVLAPILAAAAVHWVGLQHGPHASDLCRIPENLRFDNFGAAFVDFADTAGCVANLDLVVTVDTAVAHLAGAMGKPVWVLLPFVPDWRWMRSREDSPWYPTMRLFRQARAGDWPGVVEKLAGALNTAVKEIP
ncbi:MAG: tetratricopeptide repeat protein [Pseudomonadota bacterium]